MEWKQIIVVAESKCNKSKKKSSSKELPIPARIVWPVPYFFAEGGYITVAHLHLLQKFSSPIIKVILTPLWFILNSLLFPTIEKRASVKIRLLAIVCYCDPLFLYCYLIKQWIGECQTVVYSLHFSSIFVQCKL